MKATVSERGQVTIPKKLRERLGIRPGQILDFHEEQGRLIAIKISAQDPVDSVYGVISLPEGDTDQWIRELRDEAGES